MVIESFHESVNHILKLDGELTVLSQSSYGKAMDSGEPDDLEKDGQRWRTHISQFPKLSNQHSVLPIGIADGDLPVTVTSWARRYPAHGYEK